jgi:putative peptidoglycan lipid II flippase
VDGTGGLMRQKSAAEQCGPEPLCGQTCPAHSGTAQRVAGHSPMTEPPGVAQSNPEPSPSLSAVGRSAVILTGATLIAQMISFVRQLFLASEVGISSGLDALFIGMAMPMATIVVLTAGIRIAIVPTYVQTKREQGAARARYLVGAVLVWLGLAAAIAAMALWLFADGIIAITGPGLTDAGAADDAVRYLRLLAPMVMVGMVTSILLAVTQAEAMFTIMAVVLVLEPLLGFVIMVHYWDSLGLDGFVAGTLVGALAGLGCLLAATIAKHVAPIPRLRPRGVGLSGLFRFAAPLTLGTVVLEVNTTFGRAISSVLLAGGVSVLRFGASLVNVPFAAVRSAWITALYPALVQASQGSNQTELAARVERLIRFALVFFVPIAALTIAVAPVATAIAYDRGSFDSGDLALTATVVAVSAPLIVTGTIQPTLGSALSARRKGRALLSAAVIDLIVSVVLMTTMGHVFGVVGVALAVTTAAIVVVFFQAYQLKLVEPALKYGAVWGTFIRSLLSVLPSAIVFGVPIWAGAVDGGLIQRVIVLAVAGVAGLTSYYRIARWLGLKEANSIVGFAKGILRDVLRRVLVRA